MGLGYAFIFGGPSIASLEYEANVVGVGIISISAAFSIAFTLFWAGVVLFPVGLAILVYGIAAKEPSPLAVSAQTSA